MFRNSARRLLNHKCLNRSVSTTSLQNLTPEKPIPGLFSLKGWQKGCIDRTDYLSAMLSNNIQDNESLQNKALEPLIIECSQSTAKRQIGNYASLLYNLDFALSSLKGCEQELQCPKPNRNSLLKNPDLSLGFKNEPRLNGNEKLNSALEASFESLVQFRTLLLNSNLAINGDGYTWLVARVFKPKIQMMRSQMTSEIKFDELFVFNTYNSGSPLIMNKSGILNKLEEDYENRELEQQAGNKKNTESTSTQSTGKSTHSTSSYYNEMASLDEVKRMAFDDTDYVPLLAIDASPKMWLTDYGVFGKREYLNRIWDSIDWNIVESRLPPKHDITYS